MRHAADAEHVVTGDGQLGPAGLHHGAYPGLAYG